MLFRKQMSVNTQDSKVVVDGNRVVISNGIKKRCELVLNALLRLGNGDFYIMASELNAHLKSRFADGGYTSRDLSYALGRLVSGGLVVKQYVRNGLYAYRASHNAMKAWRSLPKEMV